MSRTQRPQIATLSDIARRDKLFYVSRRIYSRQLMINGKTFKPTDIDEDGYQYFVNDRLEHEGKLYKLIWLIHDEQVYVGVVNAYRRSI